VFDHVTIRVSERAASERFYRLVLKALELEPTYAGADFAEWNDFSLAQAEAEKPPTRRLHIGFAARSREHVDAFWQAGIDANYADDGAPGLRPEYGPDYYGGFLLDPDGNSAEAVHHDNIRGKGCIDHLWIRVADVDASTAFYELAAPHGGFRLKARRPGPDRTQFAGANGSFSVVAGEPTQALHLAFPAETNERVDAFHAALTEAGYRDNGAPGERPVYHPGYYAAYVLDPDGNNVEVVNHNRDASAAGAVA
jgi:catechol 2,3-dioxygenase-like lactoylglutathione lyase family enzyme